jgi:hypothetical protein
MHLLIVEPNQIRLTHLLKQYASKVLVHQVAANDPGGIGTAYKFVVSGRLPNHQGNFN